MTVVLLKSQIIFKNILEMLGRSIWKFVFLMSAMVAALPMPANAGQLVYNGGFEIGSGQSSLTGIQTGVPAPASGWTLWNNQPTSPIGIPSTATIVSSPRTQGAQAIDVNVSGWLDGIAQRFSPIEGPFATSLSADVFVYSGTVGLMAWTSDGLTFLGQDQSTTIGQWQRLSLNFAPGTPVALVTLYSSDYNDLPTHFVADNVSAQGGVPEPATWAMLVIGFGGIGVAMRRKRREALDVMGVRRLIA